MPMIYLSEETAERLRSLATAECRPVSNQVTKLLDVYEAKQ